MNTRFEPTLWQGETPLTCCARREETRDAATFTLSADGQAFRFFAGQFLSVGVEIDGRTHWRAYSISSSPNRSDSLDITVKRVDGGLVSNWLLDHLLPGMKLPALAPAGEFGLDGRPLPQAVLLFSAGSGVTPMYAMSQHLLETRTEVEIHFFHSARSEADFIFASQLLALAAGQQNFYLHLFLTRPEGGVDSHRGRLDAERLKSLLPRGKTMAAWLCGADGYMDDVSSWLSEAGVAAIYRESFTPPTIEIAADAAHYTLDVPAFGKTVDIAAGETLLDVMEREGLPIIGACRTGVCGSCKCKVQNGEVTSTSTLALTPDEIAAGFVLACSSTAQSDLTVSLN